MRADRVATRDSILEKGSDGLRVQTQHMVAFQEGIHDQLPVSGDRMGFAPEQVAFAHEETVEILAQLYGMGKICLFPRAKPDQSASFAAGQLDQAVIILVDAREGFRARQGKQLPVETIGPGVVGAHQPLRTLHLAAFDEPCSTMATDVDKDMRRAITITRNQQRAARRIMRHRHARIRQECRGAEHLRQAIEQRCLLALEMRRIGIDAGRNIAGFGSGAMLAAQNRFGQGQLSTGWLQTGEICLYAAHRGVPIPTWRG